ncbi:MAG TPA: phosphotransferase [Afipia sp.]
MLRHAESKPIAQQGGLAASYTAMLDDEAVALARSFYDLDAQVVRLTTEKDDTFRLECGNGERYVLKVANPAEDQSEVDCQVELLRHIEMQNPELPVPRVIKTSSRLWHFHYEDRVGQSRRVRLMSYLEGVPLSEVKSSAGGREEVGKILGRLRLAMAEFRHSADSRVLAWDVKHLLHLRPLLAEIANERKRERLETAFARFSVIEPRLAKCRTQVVHNDFSKSNVVVHKDYPSHVSGVIDFGDAVRTAVAVDLSTALLNQLSSGDDDDIFADGRDLLRGYLTVADLTEEELNLIPHLVMGRVIARALLTIWRARLFPENATYILRNTEQGWKQLEWFLNRSIPEVSKQFHYPAF